jgi:undecaprenyl diphosphate synthase
MDGNGRWASNRHLPRAAGHKVGVKALRKVVEECIDHCIEVLTVYAFSSENWQRPSEEVNFLMDLLITAIQEQVNDLHKNDVVLSFIGDRSAFSQKLQGAIAAAELLTRANSGMNLVIAANYGGRWDITTACRKIATQISTGNLTLDDLDEQLLGSTLCLGNLPEPDLFIRTGGEIRVSNYLLWQLAYTELYFTSVLWPDFDATQLNLAIDWYLERQRRFGKTSEQVEQVNSA